MKQWRRRPAGVLAAMLLLALVSGWHFLGLERWNDGELLVTGEHFLEVPQIVWGLNNQKIAIARAALTARFLNRSLLMPLLSASLFHNSTHPAQPVAFESVFSLREFNSRCSGFVRIAPRSLLQEGFSAVEVIKGSGRRWTAARDLEHLQDCRSHDEATLKIVGKNPFLWHDHWDVKDYIRVFQCLVLTDEIMSDIGLVASELATLSPSYVAIHMRIEQDWMIHCRNTEKRALEKDGKRLSICSSKEEIIQRVSRIASLKRPALLYLAVADVLLVNQTSLLHGWGEELVPVEKKRLGVLPIYAKHSYLVQAAMDYEICLRAAVFVGNSFSTFSSLIVLERSLRWPDSCQASFAYNLVTSDGSAQPWRTDLSKHFLSEVSYESTLVNCSKA